MAKKTQTYMPLSVQVERAIRQSGMTPHELALKAGVSPPQLYKFLNNGTGLTLATLDKIGNVLGWVIQPPLAQEVEFVDHRKADEPERKTGTYD